MSMKFFTAVIAPPITRPMPENTFSTALIPEVAAPMPLMAPRDRIHGTCNLRCHRHDRADCTHDLSNKDKDRSKSSHEKCHHEDDLLYWLRQLIEEVHQALQSRYQRTDCRHHKIRKGNGELLKLRFQNRKLTHLSCPAWFLPSSQMCHHSS